MNTNIIFASVWLALLPAMVCAEDDRPIMHESPTRLISVTESIVEENTKMAWLNVVHDVAHKRLRIFSATAVLKTAESDIFGYHLEIIQISDAAKFINGPASYRFQNNGAILMFAASQFVSGQKAFARRLVSLLADAEPGLFWSTPTHPVMTVKQILAGLEKDDDTVKDFLADWSQEWTYTVRKYGT